MSTQIPSPDTGPTEPVATGVAPTRIRWCLVTAALVLIADILTKVVVVANLAEGGRAIRLLGGAVYLVHARNSGAAFSVGTGATVVLTAISVVVVVIITRAARRLTSAPWAVALGLVLGGALGNLVDRFLRAPSVGRGHVVDWISLFADDGHIWPIFNIADSCIVIGGALAVLLSFLRVEFNGSRGAFEDDDDSPATATGAVPTDGSPERNA